MVALDSFEAVQEAFVMAKEDLSEILSGTVSTFFFFFFCLASNLILLQHLSFGILTLLMWSKLI